MQQFETFENIKHIDENGIEFWYARELMKILQYKQWRRFENVIDKAKQTCKKVILVNLNNLPTLASCQNVLIMQLLRLKSIN